MKELWDHQNRGINQVIAAVDSGERRICLTSPTGGGKSRIMAELIEWATNQRWPVALYTHRKMLLVQTGDVLAEHGIDYGLRASGHPPALLRDVQLCMTQTELSAVYQKKKRELHKSRMVLIDEAHVQTAETMLRILADHDGHGAAVVGFTATPLDIGHVYRQLIVAGTNSELRDCGALVPCNVFAPDEPNLKHIKKYKVGDDLSDADNAKAMMRHGIFGRVLANYQATNTERLPTILFAPGVKESIWFAEQFKKAGIKAAHIDGSHVWIDGEQETSTDELRQQIADGSKCGDIKIVCNRFVMREGINWPWLGHGILATVFGSLTSYVQSVGRLLRACEGLDYVGLQDHGGNYWRHGSPNADRVWEMELTNHMVVGAREERLRNKTEPEPITCPKCFAVRMWGETCHRCGYRHVTRSRMVVQVDGSLKNVEGDIVRQRFIRSKPNTEKLWEQMYHRGKSKKWDTTFAGAYGFFCHENHYFPPRDLPMMPKHEYDWFRKISDVPRENLVQEHQHANHDQ